MCTAKVSMEVLIKALVTKNRVFFETSWWYFAYVGVFQGGGLELSIFIMGALSPQRAPNSIAMCTTLMNMERSNSSFSYTKIESFLKLKEEYFAYVGAKGGIRALHVH